jgi:hypothetical protein
MSASDEPGELDRLLAAPGAKPLMDALMTFTPAVTVIARAPDLAVLRVSAFAARLIGRDPAHFEAIPLETFVASFQAHDAQGRPLSMERRPLIRALNG